MGCWNHTCALSNLPVHYGDEVYVFLLEEAWYQDSYCYPSHTWVLMPFHFEGEYNDYGAVENCKGTMLELIIDGIKGNLVEMEQGKNEFHDIPVNKANFDVDKLFEADHEGRLFVRGQHGYKEKLRIKHIVILKDVLDKLLDTYTIERMVKRNDTKKERYEYVTSTFKDFETDAMCYVQKILEEQEKAEDKITFAFFLPDFERDEPGSWFARFMDSSRTQSITFNTKRIFRHVLTDETIDSSLKRSSSMEIVRHIAIYNWLEMFMGDARKSWHIPSGTGSQDSSTSAQRTLAHIILEVGKSIDNRWDEDDETDE